jgi:hypothetical protein
LRGVKIAPALSAASLRTIAAGGGVVLRREFAGAEAQNDGGGSHRQQLSCFLHCNFCFGFGFLI